MDHYFIDERGSGYWIIREKENEPIALFHHSLPNAYQEAIAFCDKLNNKIGEPLRDLAMVEVRALLYRINRKVNELKQEGRKNMTTENALDQAVDALGTAAAAKLAEDQVLDTLANDEAAETAKVQAVTDSLTAETAAEQAALAPVAPAAAAPAAAEATPAAAAPAVAEAAATTTGS